MIGNSIEPMSNPESDPAPNKASNSQAIIMPADTAVPGASETSAVVSCSSEISQPADDTPSMTASDELSDDAATEEGSVEEGSDTETTIAEAAANTAANVNPHEVPTDSNENERNEGGDGNDQRVNGINYLNFPYCLGLQRLWAIMLGIHVGIAIVAYITTMVNPGLIRRKDIEHPNVIDLPLLMIPREKWDSNLEISINSHDTYIASRVAVVQTDTRGCDMPIKCIQLLNLLKRQFGPWKYNFLLSTDGYVYEALGWNIPSTLLTDMPTMTVAFIGDYKEISPSFAQLVQLQNLLGEAEQNGYLQKEYKIIGKKMKTKPNKLFSYLQLMKQWDFRNSDTIDHPVDIANLTEVIEILGI